MDNKPTTGSIETTDAIKRKFALESLEYNVKNEKIFCTLFPDYVDLWNRREEERKAKLLLSNGEDASRSKEGDTTMAVVPTNTGGLMMVNNVVL